jgi:Flp pilus assembly protein TadB
MVLSQLLLIIALGILATSIILVGLHINRQKSGVGIHDEWIETKSAIAKTKTKRNLAIGFITSFTLAYVLTGRLSLALLALPLGYAIANYLNNKKEERRKALLEEQYTQVLNVIIASLQGGSNPYQALEETVTTLRSPAKEVFIEILRRTRTGVTYHEAIGAAEKEVNWEDLKQLEMAFRLYDKTGSDLVKVCSYLLENAYDRRGNKKYIQAATSQITTTATVLSIIPFGLMGFMRIVAPEFAYPLFNTPGGIMVILLISGMVYAGNKIAYKMVSSIG